MTAQEPPTSRPSTEAAPGGTAGSSFSSSNGERPAGDRRGREREHQSIGSFFKELPVLIIVAFALAFLLRTFVVQVFYIPSSSMEPTLLVNDRILVDKLTYRFRDLRHGEIVVFEGDSEGIPEPEVNPVQRVVRGIGQLIGLAPANARDYVKRVVGLPGDVIEITDGVVTVNGTTLDEPYAVEDVSDCGPLTVPEDSYFFLGDNRPNSADSRAPGGLGWVGRERVVGKAFLVIWPFERLEMLESPTYADIPEASEAAPPRPAEMAPIQGLCEPAA